VSTDSTETAIVDEIERSYVDATAAIARLETLARLAHLQCTTNKGGSNESLRAARRLAVQRLFELGRTWRTIGEVLGVSRQRAERIANDGPSINPPTHTHKDMP
jgi:hypothetical protein